MLWNKPVTKRLILYNSAHKVVKIREIKVEWAWGWEKEKMSSVVLFDGGDGCTAL